MEKPATLNLNVEIRDLPQSSNRILDLLCKSTGKRKWEVIRDALIFYADAKQKDLIRQLTAMGKGDKR